MYFHVDDFAGLYGGSYGGLVPLEGTKSLWCGARASTSDPALCSYASLPGYGNNWRQAFCTLTCLSVTGLLRVSYLVAYDTEQEYDFIDLQYDACDDDWKEFPNFAPYSGVGRGIATYDVPAAVHGGSARIRFRVRTDPVWSDEDGFFNTDGAFLVDSLTVFDDTGVLLPTENFEDEAVGSSVTTSGDWGACNDFGYGVFAGLFAGSTVLQEDPCVNDISCLWAFYQGSAYSYACGGFPGQAAVPHANARGQYLANEVWSPPVTLETSRGQTLLFFDVYRDLAYDGLVFYTWSVRPLIDGCPQAWRNDLALYFGSDKRWIRQGVDLSPFIDPGASAIQIALGVRDMCRFWCGVYGTGACHSHSPLFDNVAVVHVSGSGMRWFVREFELFQDSFASDGTTTGTVRADIALDVTPAASPNVLPGDSAVFSVSDYGGLATDPYSGQGAAVYAYMSVRPLEQPGKTGAALTGSSNRFPFAGSVSVAGRTWYRLRADSVRVAGSSLPYGLFCVDLNDNLFTPGDTVEYFFSATSSSGGTSYWSEATGPVDELGVVASAPIEFTCLPAAGLYPGNDILYVDDCDGRGVQQFFDSAFGLLGLSGKVDRYDVRGPTSSVGNGLATRVADVYAQLIGVYRTIVWSSGEMRL